jgi:hypothetical protein
MTVAGDPLNGLDPIHIKMLRELYISPRRRFEMLQTPGFSERRLSVLQARGLATSNGEGFWFLTPMGRRIYGRRCQERG